MDSSGERLQIFGIHLDRGMLVDQFDCQHEPQAAASSHKRSLHTLQDTALYADSVANHKLAIRLNPLLADAGAKKFDVGIWKRQVLPFLANNLQHTRGLKNLVSLPGIDVYKQIARKQR